MTAVNKADAARRITIFTSSPKMHIYDQEKSNAVSNNKYTELQNSSTSNFKQPQTQHVQAQLPQIQYVQVKLADGRSVEVPDYVARDLRNDENPPFSSTHLPNASHGRKSVNF